MRKNKLYLTLFLLFGTFPFLHSCKDPDLEVNDNIVLEYSIKEAKIYSESGPIQLIGANSFHVFGPGSSDMNIWKIDIAREFIGNAKDTPIVGNPIQDSNMAYLHSLQSIVDANRLNNRITILCGFGWDGTNATEFTGKSPSQTYWWTEYKSKITKWAMQFKNQQDVWIEVWNEPYRYDRADNYNDAVWTKDMNELVAQIRNAGNKNIILVPCAEQGQDESVLLNEGLAFIANKTNIIFDIHAYEKWLLDTDVSVANRLAQLQQKKIPILFGETAPMNAGVLMNPQSFLEMTYNNGLSVCAWTWKKDENDTNSLLTQEGLPNNNNNNNWGTLFKNLASKPRIP